MREERKIIGQKGLVTLPHEWRESHNLAMTENVLTIYKPGGALIITPMGRSLSSLEEACINFLEKGPSVNDLRGQVGALKEAELIFSQALESLLEDPNAP